MITEINLVLSPRDASDEKFYKFLVAKNLKIESNRITDSNTASFYRCTPTKCENKYAFSCCF